MGTLDRFSAMSHLFPKPSAPFKLYPLPDQFILFGDSITQQAYNPDLSFSLGAALSNAYVRKLDIINRGLSGYNTTQALEILPSQLPHPDQAKVRFLAIAFGANDARVHGSPGGPPQDVPLDQFKANVKAIIQHSVVQAHKDVHLILITTPPIHEKTLSEHDTVNYGDEARSFGLRRTCANALAYATAVREVGREIDVTVCDLWTAMVKFASPEVNPRTGSLEMEGSKENERLKGLLSDGLHFTGEGYRIFYEELVQTVEGRWPEDGPEEIGMAVPAWDDGGVWEG